MRRRTDSGAVPVEFAAAIGFLLIPTFIFAVTIAPVVERKAVAGRAAAEAARAFVLADDVATGQAAAQSIVDRINAGHPFTLTLSSLSGGLDRGSVVTATVEVSMPVIIFPTVIEIRVADYTATHQEVVELFRSLP
jgi:Flp pilus assembly protein TadG